MVPREVSKVVPPLWGPSKHWCHSLEIASWVRAPAARRRARTQPANHNTNKNQSRKTPARHLNNWKFKHRALELEKTFFWGPYHQAFKFVLSWAPNRQTFNSALNVWANTKVFNIISKFGRTPPSVQQLFKTIGSALPNFFKLSPFRQRCDVFLKSGSGQPEF